MKTVYLERKSYGSSWEVIHYSKPEQVDTEQRYLMDPEELKMFILKAMKERGNLVGKIYKDDDDSWIGWTMRTINKLITEALND